VRDHLIAAGYIHENYPVERVGSFQSGAIGYFDPNVENLDGKLNQYALAATAANRIGDFIDSERIDVLVDRPAFLIGHLPEDYRNREWQACPRPTPASDIMCLIRKHPFAPIPGPQRSPPQPLPEDVRPRQRQRSAASSTAAITEPLLPLFLLA
jgi:hypothetical protein